MTRVGLQFICNLHSIYQRDLSRPATQIDRIKQTVSRIARGSLQGQARPGYSPSGFRDVPAVTAIIGRGENDDRSRRRIPRTFNDKR